MASAEGETDNGVATVKQSELKLVQIVKKITNQVDCELILTEKELSWTWQPTTPAAQTKGKDENQTKGHKTNSASTEESVRIKWLLRAKVETAKATEKPEGEENGETSSELIIHYIRRHDQPEFRYSMAQVKFSGPTNICTEWETVITDLLAKTAPLRPKSLLVIINPVSGYKKGEKIYRDKVAPIFDIAGINAEVVVTKKSKDSAEILENHDLSKFDGVLSVGGDGTHTEVSSALLENAMKAGGVQELTPSTVPQPPTVKFGMIPTGSGNGRQQGSSYSRDVVTCALVIVLGDSQSRSVSTIHCGEKFLAYSYLLIGYGFLSQIMEIMENNRWAGPARYLAVAFITLVKRKAIEVQLDYLPGDEESMADFEIFSEVKHEKSTKGSSVDPPATSPAGGAEAEQKATDQAEGADAEQKGADQAEGADTEEKATSPAEGADAEQKGSNEAAEVTTEEKGRGEADGGNAGEATGEASSEQAKSDESQEKENKTEKGAEAAVGEQEEEAAADPLPEGWKRVSGKFIGIDCFSGRLDKVDMTRLYMTEDALDPEVLGLSITQPCGRIEHAKHMRKLQKGDAKKCFAEAGFAKILGVKAFNIKAIGEWRNSSKANAIDWDGDMLYSPEPHFEVRCHAGILPTFARSDGPELKRICIEEEEKKKAALKAEQERKEQAAKEKKEAAAAANNKTADNKTTEVEEKPAEVDGKPSEGESKAGEGESKPGDTESKPTESEPAATEGAQEEADEKLPKAEVEIKVTAAPETDSQ